MCRESFECIDIDWELIGIRTVLNTVILITGKETWASSMLTAFQVCKHEREGQGDMVMCGDKGKHSASYTINTCTTGGE